MVGISLIHLHDAFDKAVYDSVIVTDRRVLDKQLQEDIMSFDHTDGAQKPLTTRNARKTYGMPSMTASASL